MTTTEKVETEIKSTTSEPKKVETPEAQAKVRAAACNAAIQDLLIKFRCQIVPMLTSESVGTGPSMKMMLGATYGILPELDE